MFINIFFSFMAFYNILSKWILVLSNQDLQSTLISFSSVVNLTFLLLAACYFLVFFLAPLWFADPLVACFLSTGTLLSTWLFPSWGTKHWCPPVALGWPPWALSFVGPNPCHRPEWEWNRPSTHLKAPHNIMASYPCLELIVLMKEVRPLPPRVEIILALLLQTTI